MKITFYGAAQGVTGSKHLIETEGYRFLLDCGMFQGHRSEADKLNLEFPLDAKSVDAVILSHAHVDHCGLLPLLVRKGFSGSIYCTGATADVANFMMADCARIQEQDAMYMNRHKQPDDRVVQPLSTEEEANAVLSHFVHVPYFRLTQKWTQLNERIRFKLYDAGHILGSAVILLEIQENGQTKTLAFSGDLGQRDVPLLRSPEPIEENVDTFLLETTYGDRNHEPQSEVKKILISVITDALRNRSKIIVPAFSLGRTQELIYILHQLFDDQSVPRIPIYLDSPLAENLNTVFSRHIEDFDTQTGEDFDLKKEMPLIFSGLTYIQSVEESKALNTHPGPLMIISASGMMEAGRVLHHLKNSIEDPNAVVLITGYQAQNTLGRRIQDGQKEVRIFNESYTVRAKVMSIGALSAHADQQQLLEYLRGTHGVKNLFLVHTEPEAAIVFQELVEKEIPGMDIRIPKRAESFDV